MSEYTNSACESTTSSRRATLMDGAWDWMVGGKCCFLLGMFFRVVQVTGGDSVVRRLSEQGYWRDASLSLINLTYEFTLLDKTPEQVERGEADNG